MKKFIALLLSALMLTAMLTACSNDTGAPSSSNPDNTNPSTPVSQKTYKILSGSGEGVAAYDVMNAIVEKYKAEVNQDFEVEYEIITSTADLWQKLQMYYTAKTLPDIFAVSNGTLSEEMISKNKLLNMTDVLTDTGHYDDVAPSMIDYFTSSDGKMYMIPSTFSGEFFVYRKTVFEKHNLEAPATWDAFLKVCQTLKDNNEIPYVMRGADYVQYLRFLSFPSWTTDGREFVAGLSKGEYSYSESSLGLYAAELMQKLGTSGYFVPGFENMTLSDVADTFMSGLGAMMYTNANYVSKLSDLYDAGEIGWFGVPTVDGVEGTGSTIPTHGGKAWGFNPDSYNNDPVLQDFVKFLLDNVDEVSYDNGALSWYRSDIPEGSLNAMMTEIGKAMKQQSVSWVSWDDRLTAATTTTVGDAGKKLAYGTINPEEFCSIFDQALIENKG